jgi:hypothetical protein
MIVWSPSLQGGERQGDVHFTATGVTICDCDRLLVQFPTVSPTL